jgi:SAM-dependent methyltransferase
VILVELGGGLNPHPEADVVIDKAHPVGSWRQDVTHTPWHVDDVFAVTRSDVGMYHDGVGYVLGDDCVDQVYASHLMEHVPKGDLLVAVMNEAWRILRPGGVFTIIVPLIGWTSPTARPEAIDRHHWVARPEAWADPTHVSHWWFPESLHYFTGQIAPAADYDLRPWEPVTAVDSDHAAILLDDPGAGLGWWTVRGADGWEGVARLVKP